MTTPKPYRTLDARASIASLAAVALIAIVAVWGVQQVYGHSLTRTSLATQEFTDDVIVKTRGYHNYQNFTEDGVTSRYTYLYAKAVEDCFSSVRLALYDSAGEAVGADPDLDPQLCAPPSDDPSEETYYAGWNYRESIFNETADFAESRSYIYQLSGGGGYSGGWRIFFYDDVSIEHECHQSNRSSCTSS